MIPLKEKIESLESSILESYTLLIITKLIDGAMLINHLMLTILEDTIEEI